MRVSEVNEFSAKIESDQEFSEVLPKYDQQMYQ